MSHVTADPVMPAPDGHGLEAEVVRGLRVHRRLFGAAGSAFFLWKLEQALRQADRRKTPGALGEAAAVALLGPVLVWLTSWWAERLARKAHRDHRELLFLHRLARQEIAERERAQAALAEANARLEARVEERTRALRREMAERERAEAALQGQEKLAATGRMAAQMAHEINNPLAGVKNAFRLLREAIPGDHPDGRYVGLVDAEIDRIARIVRQTLDLHRPQVEPPQRLSVDRAVADVVELLEPHPRAADVRVRAVMPMPPVEVTMPAGLLHQVLFNLLENALEASPARGEVVIAAGRDGDDLRLTVVDEGAGIPDTMQDRVFEPFFTTKSGRGADSGVGLGLAVSRSLVQAAGGELTFTCAPEGGTRFTVILPARERP